MSITDTKTHLTLYLSGETRFVTQKMGKLQDSGYLTETDNRVARDTATVRN